MSRRSIFAPALIAFCVLVALEGCEADPADRPPDPEDAPAPAFRADTLVRADSVPLWIQDIREGISPLAGRVGADPEGARQRAVELYVTRQERIEQTVGAGTGAAVTSGPLLLLAPFSALQAVASSAAEARKR